MFSKAIALAAQYTRPVIISRRLFDKSVSSGIATFVVINNEGWALTCAHVVQDALTAQSHAKEVQEHANQAAVIEANPSYSSGKKKHELGLLKSNPSWITNHSLWWAADGIMFQQIHLDPPTDLALVQLKGPIQNMNVKSFPTLAQPTDEIKQGTSLCRLGFPFHDVKAVFDDNLKQFSIPDLPMLATFPNDGILTRNILFEDAATKRKTYYLETSSAGLRGQSGGPIVDVNGKLWAIQSKTTHLPLGFSPTVEVNGKKIIEYQFMHCGWGTHVSHVRELLDKFSVSYQS